MKWNQVLLQVLYCYYFKKEILAFEGRVNSQERRYKITLERQVDNSDDIYVIGAYLYA